jgi:hypothetical protein
MAIPDAAFPGIRESFSAVIHTFREAPQVLRETSWSEIGDMTVRTWKIQWSAFVRTIRETPISSVAAGAGFLLAMARYVPHQDEEDPATTLALHTLTFIGGGLLVAGGFNMSRLFVRNFSQDLRQHLIPDEADATDRSKSQ